MLFNSYIFVLGFLPLMLAAWWLVPGHRTRLILLTLASYWFYGWWNYRFVPLMILSTSADFVAGWQIHRTVSRRKRTAWLVGLLIFNLGLLGIFKYFDFVASTWNAVLGPLNAPLLPLMHVVLPIGISFYTFNSISYTIDIYRGRLVPSRSFVEFAAFVAMFPHLIAGPIVRYSDMGEQFRELRRKPRGDETAVGLWLLVLGMAKKVLVADIIAAHFVTPLFASAAALRFLGAWLAVVGYTLQIYFDFSGYSDMAVGLALLLGLRFPQNFNSPYKSANPSEFWRRWHMSLSFWLRDYLFIPLGGSRGSLRKTARNIGITMFLGGLWHGASWTFVVWGLYHGVLLSGHASLKRRGLVPRSHTVAVAATFLSVMVGWVLFRAESLETAVGIIGAMAGSRGFEPATAAWRAWGTPHLLFLAAGLAVVFALPNTWQIRYPRTVAAGIGLAALFVVCLLRFATQSPFIYFQF
ncbi:MAG: MBOAT family O-acyltransferase [Candidatus Binatia bacterium]